MYTRMKKAIIIEDEKAAVRNLKAALSETDYEIDPIACLDSIAEAVEWFSQNEHPDLVFLDIHLADGSAFEIFERTTIACPVIFTTAYDEYALKAFKVNSIDYLLKPIDPQDLNRALDKLARFRKTEEKPDESLLQFIKSFKLGNQYKTHFLVPTRSDKLIPLAVKDIACIYIEAGCVKVKTHNENEYTLQQTLDELQESLDPAQFFRANRQYIISRSTVKDIDLWFNNRLSINLRVTMQERILISKARSTEFKHWLTS